MLRECIVNMARIKEAIALSFEKPREAQAIDQIPQLMRGITAGLLMLGKTRVVEIMEGIDRALGQFVRSDGMTLPQEAVDRLADAIVAVEYYMETLQAGRTDPWYMLDNAETCLRFLAEAQPIPRVEALGADWRSRAHGRHRAAVADAWRSPTEHEPHGGARSGDAPVRQHRPAARSQPRRRRSPSRSDREIDPEFLELFIEEAKDEITKLKQLFPLWDENPQDQDALVNVRRSFHTLKGSGRMVGAQLIGEFAWSVENLLNRVINKTLERTPGHDDAAARKRSPPCRSWSSSSKPARAPQADIAQHHRRTRTRLPACVRARRRRRAAPAPRCRAAAPEPPVPSHTQTAMVAAARSQSAKKNSAGTDIKPPPRPAPMDPGSARNLRQRNRGPSRDHS